MVLTANGLLRAAQEDLAFFSNEQKLIRERWVVDQWLVARGVEADVRPADDPPDFIVDGAGVEIVELLEPRRKRTDQYRANLTAAEAGYAIPRRMVSREQVVTHGHEWLVRAIKRKSAKYASRPSSTWTLLVYVNVPWADSLQWAEVVAELRDLAPPFAAIDALFQVGAAPIAGTVWCSSAQRRK